MGEREVQAYSIALQQADAELEQLRLGVVCPAAPAATLPAPPQQSPSSQQSQTMATTWAVAQVRSISSSLLQNQRFLQELHFRSLCELQRNWRLLTVLLAWLHPSKHVDMRWHRHKAVLHVFELAN